VTPYFQQKIGGCEPQFT